MGAVGAARDLDLRPTSNKVDGSKIGRFRISCPFSRFGFHTPYRFFNATAGMGEMASNKIEKRTDSVQFWTDFPPAPMHQPKYHQLLNFVLARMIRVHSWFCVPPFLESSTSEPN